ncbi:ATP-dependent DNA helicase RecG [Pelagibacteraceae bacterium]|nr:ATP-dependent DNA helicase RecG [Pelagibacteraceae bacterium]
MSLNKKKEYLFDSVSTLQGVGPKLTKYLKNKKIEKINDLLWNIPYDYSDRRKTVELDKLQVGKILTIKVKVKKYNFPRLRRLPNRINCEDSKGKIDIIFFNSREGYIKKILPINNWVVISGKINFYKNKYQITNPEYITQISDIDYVAKIIPKYSLTEGLNEKSYRKIIKQVLDNMPEINEWFDESFIKKMSFLSWKECILKIHDIKDEKDLNSNIYKRLAYDEIFAHLLTLSKNRRIIKINKKNNKFFSKKISNKIIESLDFELTKSQIDVLNDIETDLLSKKRMFRILQGDVGSGKTIVSFLASCMTIESGFQSAFMAPTEILARQHYDLSKKIFKDIKINIEFLSGKTEYKIKKKIFDNLKKGKIDLIIGTHALFQKKVFFKNLGLVIVDEQHKFGVKQRMSLAKKGGDNCDVLLMSATPIPRSMMMTLFGDMDISKITEKPINRKKTITLTKPEEKIKELWPYIKKEIKLGNQIFWVCPLIEESQFLNFSSVTKRFDILNKLYPKKVGIIHGSMTKDEKDLVLNNFLNKEISILVSTTVIEVGIDFPNANLIVIENSNKFGLAQLHQLRGRVGRGSKQAVCILLFKDTLSKKAVKRLKILKSTDDGFLIADEDMRLRGYGDIVGFQQSGIKYFRIADPVHHEDLFKIAEKKIKEIENDSFDGKRYNFLLKLFDRAEIINEEEVG